MLCPYSNIDQNPDYTMAEFTIFPTFRRKHFALDAAKMILDKHKGKWEIKYNEKNGGAKKLWNTLAAQYEPEVHHLNEEETVLSFDNNAFANSHYHQSLYHSPRKVDAADPAGGFPPENQEDHEICLEK